MKTVRLVAINALVFLALLAGLELFFRAKGSPADAAVEQRNGMQLHTLPYMMFANPPRSHYSVWHNTFSGQDEKADITANNEGFNDPRDFDWRKPYTKTGKEKVVLVTGGSTVWGLGSTSFAATIAGALQTELNRARPDVKYTVINLGMGSWIAYQQFIGLEMWGTQFDPDWVIIMDGHNDAGVGCAYSQGVTNPLYFPALKSLVDAYSATGFARPVYLRSWIENELIYYSTAYRTLTGKKYIPASEVDTTSHDAARNAVAKVVVPTNSALPATCCSSTSRQPKQVCRCFREQNTFSPRNRWLMNLPAILSTCTNRLNTRLTRPRWRNGRKRSKSILKQMKTKFVIRRHIYRALHMYSYRGHSSSKNLPRKSEQPDALSNITTLEEFFRTRGPTG